MVSNWKVGPYLLELVPNYSGPFPCGELSSEADTVAAFIDRVLTEDGAHFRQAIVEEKSDSDAVCRVSPATDARDARAMQETWESLTGERLEPQELARVGSGSMIISLPSGIVSWAALRKAVAELEAVRKAWRPVSGPGLFTRPTQASYVTPDDVAIVKSLETEVTTIEALDLEVEVGREPQALIARRREFLRRCQEAAIFAGDYPSERKIALSNFLARRLLDLRLSVLELRRWGFLAEDQDPLDGRICLDFVRLKLWPNDENGQSWARDALKMVPETSDGEQGSVYQHVGHSTITVWWRKDSYRPALLAVSKS